VEPVFRKRKTPELPRFLRDPFENLIPSWNLYGACVKKISDPYPHPTPAQDVICDLRKSDAPPYFGLAESSESDLAKSKNCPRGTTQEHRIKFSEKFTRRFAHTSSALFSGRLSDGAPYRKKYLPERPALENPNSWRQPPHEQKM
jgi:hypothetical protein